MSHLPEEMLGSIMVINRGLPVFGLVFLVVGKRRTCYSFGYKIVNKLSFNAEREYPVCICLSVERGGTAMQTLHFIRQLKTFQEMLWLHLTDV